MDIDDKNIDLSDLTDNQLIELHWTAVYRSIFGGSGIIDCLLCEKYRWKHKIVSGIMCEYCPINKCNVNLCNLYTDQFKIKKSSKKFALSVVSAVEKEMEMRDNNNDYQ